MQQQRAHFPCNPILPSSRNCQICNPPPSSVTGTKRRYTVDTTLLPLADSTKCKYAKTTLLQQSISQGQKIDNLSNTVEELISHKDMILTGYVECSKKLSIANHKVGTLETKNQELSAKVEELERRLALETKHYANMEQLRNMALTKIEDLREELEDTTERENKLADILSVMTDLFIKNK